MVPIVPSVMMAMIAMAVPVVAVMVTLMPRRIALDAAVVRSAVMVLVRVDRAAGEQRQDGKDHEKCAHGISL